MLNKILDFICNDKVIIILFELNMFINSIVENHLILAIVWLIIVIYNCYTLGKSNKEE